jgi:hypothetical protein
MRGAIPPLRITSSWRGAELSTGATLPLPLPTLTFVELVVCSKSFTPQNLSKMEPGLKGNSFILTSVLSQKHRRSSMSFYC